MKPLILTNPYLKDKKHREAANMRSAITSCGVEGIKVTSLSKVSIPVDTTKTQAALNKIKFRLNRN